LDAPAQAPGSDLPQRDQLGCRRPMPSFPRRTMMWAKYRSFDEFERDEIRPGLRVGWSLDNINDPNSIEMDFDEDPFERALLEADSDLDEDEPDAPETEVQ
jgi:hypothetical protein